MTRRDLLLLAAWAALAIFLIAPAGFDWRATPFNFGDLYTYHYPLRHSSWSAVQAGRLPFWNPYIFSGLPLLANSQTALFYPVSVLSALFPLTLGLSWDFLFHLFWAGFGAFLLSKRAGLAVLPAWIMGLAYALTPFLAYRIVEGIPTLLASLSWAPWAWLAWRARRGWLLAGVWALQFLSGHPQFLVLNAAAMLLWGVVRPSRVDWGAFARGALGAMLLAAAQWPLTWEFMRHSVRRSWPAAFTEAYAIEWRSLLCALHPDAWGNPLSGTFSGPPSVFFETSGLYLGGLGLALAAAGLWLSRPRGAGLLAACGVLLSLSGAASLGIMRTPSRWLFLSLWGLWLALGAGWAALSRRGLPAGARTLLGCGILAELLLWDARFLKAERPDKVLEAKPAIAQAIAGAPFRVLTHPDIANPNKTMLYRAKNVNGYEAFYLDGYPEYAARSEGAAAADPSRTHLRRHDSSEMERLGVSVRLEPWGALTAAPRPWTQASFLDAAGRRIRAPLVHYNPSPERWELRAKTPAAAARLVFSQPFYPGWRAFLNGREAALERWDGFLQAVALPASMPGEPLSAVLAFEPTRWPWLAAVSAASWLLWLGFLARREEFI